MNFPYITFIGAGNMGSALIGGLINNHHPKQQICACDPSEEKRLAINDTYQILTTSVAKSAVLAADVVVLAVKPQILAAVTKELAPYIAEKKPLVISIAAGIREESIQEWLQGSAAIVRVMPNTPALFGCGASALYANSLVTVKQRELAESILKSVGLTVWLEKEEWMDIVTALSGSGPAYYFLIIEAFQQAAEELGLPANLAQPLALQTALGACRMAMASKHSLTELRQQVTSKGGTTEKALSVLENNQLRKIFKQTLQAAKIRSEELAEQLRN